jgi:hypothetical protein
MQVSMPSASTSTFMRPSASMSSLSHSMKVRSSMAALPIGTSLVEPLAGQHEAADMLREMARKADQLAGEVDRQADGGVWDRARLADMVVGQTRCPTMPQTVSASAR